MTIQTGIGTGLSRSTNRAIRGARTAISDTGTHEYRSIIVLYDGLGCDGEEVAHRIRRQFGPRVRFAGGAASDNYQLDSTPVFHGDDIVHDGIVIATIDSNQPIILTDSHGHEPISEPLEVTATSGRMIEELNGEPAFDVWRAIVKPYARDMFDIDIDESVTDRSQLLRMTGVFEFGIDQGGSYKMRACIESDPKRGTMSSLVAIPEGTRLRIMRGTVESQIASAKAAAKASHEASIHPYAGAFVFDCCCRHVILGDEFERAIDEIRQELPVPLIGFETYGELCMDLDETSGFHNSTTVIGLVPE